MKILITVIFFTTYTSILIGQSGITNFLQTPEIANQLSEMYLEPMAKMTNGAINAGWYHTAKIRRFLGFDLSLSMSNISTPTTSKGFYLTDIKDFDTYYTLKDGGFPVTPNVAGVSTDLSVIKSKENGREIVMPNGSGLYKISIPIISASIGLPYNTEVRVKFIPKINNGDLGKQMQYGFSIMHSVKEYIPGLDEIPALSLSLMGGYTGLQNDMEVSYPASTSNNQLLKGTSSGYTGRLLIGMDVAVFSAFMGVGYGVSSTEYALKGNYYIGDITNAEEVSNPISVSYDYAQLEYNIGIAAKIGVFDVFADYSPGDYHTFNFGLSFNMR